MTAPATTDPSPSRHFRTRLVLALSALAVAAVLLIANAHLVYVAFASQPECVAHLKQEGGAGTWRAAKSAC